MSFDVKRVVKKPSIESLKIIFLSIYICQISRTERSENLMTASKHAELIRKVESLAALTDSNRLLRDEKDRLAEIVESSTLRATEALAKVEPLELKLKEAEERASTLQVEKAAIQLESEGWKKRSDQLVEKSFKMNPEELKRLQTAETDLTRQVFIFEYALS